MRALQSLFAALFAVAALLAAPPAAAQSGGALDLYRAQGVIAERYDGYVEIHDPSAPAAARSLVDEVNDKRRALYKKRAAETNAPVAAVGEIYAKQIADSAPAGTYFRKANGQYVRK